MQTKEYDLTRAVLHYAAYCMETGDWAALRDLGFGKDETAALNDLKLGEFSVLAQNLRGHILKVQLDRDRFWLTLREMQQERVIGQLKTEMVCREAPADMMLQLFGMSDREYTVIRRKHRCQRSAGRPREPDPETTDTIWRAWREHGRKDADLLSADDWLEMADDTKVDLRTLWRAIRNNCELERAS